MATTLTPPLYENDDLLALNGDNSLYLKGEADGFRLNGNSIDLPKATGVIALTGSTVADVGNGLELDSDRKASVKIDSKDNVLSTSDSGVGTTLALSAGWNELKTNYRLRLLGKDNAIVSDIDASEFVKDGMLDSVELSSKETTGGTEHYMVFTWNTDGGKKTLDVEISKFMNIYTASDGVKQDGNDFSADWTKVASVTGVAETYTTKDEFHTISNAFSGDVVNWNTLGLKGYYNYVKRIATLLGARDVEKTTPWDDYFGYSEDHIYKIDSLDKLKIIQSKAKEFGTSGITFELTTDLVLDEPWTGIGFAKGSDAYTFDGTFDGCGHTISNVTFADLSEGGTIGDINNYRGFFGCISDDATIKNLTIISDGFGDTAPTGEYGCALIVGDSRGNIDNCVAEGTVTGTHNAAGICILCKHGIISNCTNNATIICKYTKGGGIVAFAQGTTGTDCTASILNCVNNGSVTATENTAKAGRDGVGGIVGYASYVTPLTISNCINRGVVSKTDTASSEAKLGQIVGQVNTKVVTDGNNKVRSDIRAIGFNTGYAKNPTDGFNFAEIEADSEGLLTLVKDSAVTVGSTHKAMSANGTYTIANVNDSVTFDESLAAVTVSKNSTTYPDTDYSIEKTAISDTVNKYTLVANAA